MRAGFSYPMPALNYANGSFHPKDPPVAVEASRSNENYYEESKQQQAGKMTNSSQQFCLRWNNHMTNFVQVVGQLLTSEAFTDVTVIPDDGPNIKCHKMVLAAGSPYFQQLFIKTPCEHPSIILSGVKFHQIRAILNYMYLGEVNVAESDLPALLKVAESLKVKGLVNEALINGVAENGRHEVPEMPERETTPHHNLPGLNQLAALAGSMAAHVNGNGNGLPMTNGYGSPPPHVAAPFSVPFVKSALDAHAHAHSLWPALAGLHHQVPQNPISGHTPTSRAFLAGSYDGRNDKSPLSRKKMSSYMANRDTPILRNVLGGQNDSPLSDRQDNYNSNSNGSMNDSCERRDSSELEPMGEDDEKPTTPHKYNSHKEPKPEWKRYKQYTRQDIQNAMNAVKNKEMSALQAAAKYGIPSRTLYDKLKKAGILPTRNATQRANRGSSESAAALLAGSARFPYSSTMNGNVYGNGTNGVSENECEINGYADKHLAIVNSLGLTPNGMSLSRGSAEDMEIAAAHNGHHNGGHSSGNEDGAEDLSVGSRRSSDHSVIVPNGVKEEEEDEEETSMQHEDES